MLAWEPGEGGLCRKTITKVRKSRGLKDSMGLAWAIVSRGLERGI